MGDKNSIKEEIKLREEIVRSAEKSLLELQMCIANNKSWIADLREQLRGKQ